MARVRIALGIALWLVALAYAVWDVQVAWMSPVMLALPTVLLWNYALSASAGLGGRRPWRDAAFGLALFGGSDFVMGSGWSGDVSVSHAIARPLHLRAFNARMGTTMKGTETNGGFLAPSDPTISAMIQTRTAAFQGASLALGFVGAAIAVVLGRRAPLACWGARTTAAALIAGVLGIAAAFAVPGFWEGELTFHAVWALMLATALAARYGPEASRPAMFGFAMVGGACFLLGSARFVAWVEGHDWLADPVGAAVLKSSLSGEPPPTPGGRPHVVRGYEPDVSGQWARIRLRMLLATIPVGLIGAALGIAADRLSRRPRLRLAGSATLMTIVAASTVILMAFREQGAWATIESQAILLLGVLAAFRSFFGPARGRWFLAGFAVFGLGHSLVLQTALKWNAPLARPAGVVAEAAWTRHQGAVQAKAIDPDVSRRYAHYVVTIEVAQRTSSLAAALVGGCLFALLAPPRPRDDTPPPSPPPSP